MEATQGGAQVRHLSINVFFLNFLFFFTGCFTLPVWPPGEGFATGTIDLGGLLISEIKNFTKIWAAQEGGPDNLGATFYEPSSLPDGFFMLGSHSQSNTDNALPGFVLAGKDTANDPSGGALKQPTDYTLVWSSESLEIKQDGVGYIWRPTPPDGYSALGYVVTSSPAKPPLAKIRCVRSDFTETCQNGDLIWGPGDKSKSNSNSNITSVYSSSLIVTGNGTSPVVPTGTFVVQNQFNNSPAEPSACLKNVAGNFSAMPNLVQIQALMKEYSPWIYFHPKEEFLPSSVSWFFQNGGLLYTKGQESNPVNITPGGSNLPQGGANDGAYWLDLPVDSAAKETIKKGNVQSAGAYLHIKPMLGGTVTDIAIWIFYPFNGPAKAKIDFLTIDLGRIGEHVGDWEHVTLRISNFNGELKKVYFSQHGKGAWIDASQVEYQNGNKPVVYSSLHGHAAFPKTGTFLMGSGKIGIRNDAAKGNTFMDTGLNYTIVSAEFLKPAGIVSEPAWLNYAREWGPKINYNSDDEIKKVAKMLPGKLKTAFLNIVRDLPDEVLGEEGPTGPKWKSNWDGDENV